MAHHGHYRHARISRLIRARHRLEARGGDTANDSTLLGDVAPVPKPTPDNLSSEPCDASQNNTCVNDTSDASDVSLSKREEPDPAHSIVVQTIVQVVDTDSHTLWQSPATDLPMTISDSAFGALTISGSLAFPAEVPSATPVSNLPSSHPKVLPSNPNPSQPGPPLSKALSAVKSPGVTSTPLKSSSATSSVTSTSSVPSSSSSSSSVSRFSSSTSSPSSSGFWGSEQTGTATGSGSTSTNDSGNSSGSDSSNNSATPKIVGGVVGSVAGIAMIILLLLFLLRRRGFFQRKDPQTLPSEDAAAGTRAMTERRSSRDPLFRASYFGPAFAKRWRHSTQTTQTESTVDSSNPSERGFQKISGRKLPPVLTHGGDGYGGGLDGDSPTIPESLGGLAAPSSPGGGPRSPPSYPAPPTSPYGRPLDSNYTRESAENPASPPRPSPVHLPISSSVTVATPVTVTPSHPVAEPQSVVPLVPRRPDGLGRSFPSMNGSRGSRFRESLDL
ncbi:hypothetical protein NUU61_003197 [Penicillium alfredii]|uniref:Uncharacterized protein n=1 Tax=Penicillium alfredii TaxID=1506179 RepID=A0A9W9FT04_9EURO|nr:uncharacterized protein NUU61_003197 [Penicillium alfredii]KAJ5105850.1 hypothetical protein NUU61_003197 [Penicillium alfredii]